MIVLHVVMSFIESVASVDKYLLRSTNTSLFAYRSFLVDWFDDELLVVEGNISDLTPGKANLWGHPVKYWYDLPLKYGLWYS